MLLFFSCLDKSSKNKNNSSCWISERMSYWRADLSLHPQSQQQPKLLCWIIGDPHMMDSIIVHQINTWARRCHKVLVISSQPNSTFPVPVVGVNVAPGKKNLEEKVMKAWIHIYKHYVEDFDFFMRCDADVYVVVENLLDFLKGQDPAQPHYFGHRLDNYTHGGPGIVLSRQALRRLVTHAYEHFPDCMFRDGKCKATNFFCVSNACTLAHMQVSSHPAGNMRLLQATLKYSRAPQTHLNANHWIEHSNYLSSNPQPEFLVGTF